MNLQGLSLIAGAPATPSGAPFRGIDPGAGAPLDPPFHPASQADVDAAVRAARQALPALRDAAVRATFLKGIADALEARQGDIVARGQVETALPEARLQGELARTTGQLRLFAGVVEDGSWVDARIDHADAGRQPVPKPDVRSMLTAIGPVVVFGASNFPLAFSVAGGDSASAWAAGNPVIVKAHPSHPGTSELVGQAIAATAREQGLPGGVFSLLFDAGHDIGVALTQHADVCAVGFTGSRVGGVALAKIAAARAVPIPVFAEMGSINPVVFLPHSLQGDRAALASQLFTSCTMGAGQFCTNPGVAFVPEGSDGDDFVEQLSTLFRDSSMPAMLNSGIATAYERASETLEAQGAVVRGGGQPVDNGAPATARVWETDLQNVRRHPELLHEVFGPATLVVRWSSIDALRDTLAALEGQLTATVHASPEELEEHRAVWDVLASRVGRLLFGGFPTGVDVGHAMVHGGPFPATTDAGTTAVGTRALRRFARLVAFQNAPQCMLPPELQDGNPHGIERLVDGTHQR